MNLENETLFESIKHFGIYDEEFWFARELSKILEYKDYRNFELVITKAMEACKNSGNNISDHFFETIEKVTIGSGAGREFPSYKLTRYACYLIAMNGDPKKDVISQAQTYFALQTRRQELQTEYEKLSEDQKRIAIRKEMKEHNKSLADAAKGAGVDTARDYAIFQNKGYQGLYGGLGAKDIHQKKGLKKGEQILDHMGSTELAANLFRATQTDEKLRREKIQGKEDANNTHYEVGKKVRATIKELGGTMPENLPTPDESVMTVEKRLTKGNKKTIK